MREVPTSPGAAVLVASRDESRASETSGAAQAGALALSDVVAGLRKPGMTDDPRVDAARDARTPATDAFSMLTAKDKKRITDQLANRHIAASALC